MRFNFCDGGGTGTSTPGTSTEGPVGGSVANDNISQHQARLQAAASAASIYQKSFVYPSPSTLLWYTFSSTAYYSWYLI